MAEGLPGLMDGQALDNVHEAPSVDSLATTQAVDIPETQDLVSSLDTSGGSDMAVVTQLTVAPHPEQLDGGAPPGPFECFRHCCPTPKQVLLFFLRDDSQRIVQERAHHAEAWL
jgi:hypothetical protein